MNRFLLSLDRIIQTNELIKNLYIGLNSLDLDLISSLYLDITMNSFFFK